MMFIKTKTCSKCLITRPYTSDYFYHCSKTKSGLAAKCKQCSNKLAKIYMRKTRLTRRLKKLGMYEGRISMRDLAQMEKETLVEILFDVTRQFLYSGQSSRFCTVCEEYHQNKHKQPFKK